MKICIPSASDDGPDSIAFGHFGSAPFFAVVDTESGALKIVPNPDRHEDPHACHHLDQLHGHRVNAVVCNGVGRRAFAALRDAGIEVLVPANGTVGEVVDAVRSGRARSLSPEDACGGGRHEGGTCGGHGHGHGRHHPDRPGR